MPTICYESHNFSAKSLDMIELVNQTIADYTAQGYSLTLRQVYYRMVSSGYILNNDKEYKKLGELINNARLAGLIDWNAIEDRTRRLRQLSHWTDPGSLMRGAAQSYALDKWLGQEYRVEVWVEKDALVDVVGKACERLDVPYFSCRGYTSATEMWNAAQRLMSYWMEDQAQPVILHLGDHDPSGKDMSRDIEERISKFSKFAAEDEPAYFGRWGEIDDGDYCDGWPGFIFERIALNYDQIEAYNPPPNPTKLKDTRSAAYIREFGATCWELDALEPMTLDALITDKIEDYLDMKEYRVHEAKQEKERRQLTTAAERWVQLVEFLRSK
jgi:hypothetical protein